MKIKLRVTCKLGDEPIYVTTNLLCIAEWERLRGRKMSDGRGVGATDMVDWAFFMLKQSGRLIKETEPDAWHRANPELDIEGVDMTDPNPTEAAPTAAS